MLQNYLKTALRSLWNQKVSSVINISGLTLGIASSLVLFLMIRHMSSFDNFHANRDRIHRVVTTSDGNSQKAYTAGIPTVLPDAFRIDFPEAQEVTFISNQDGGLIAIPQASGD